jgi:hypothetical protein
MEANAVYHSRELIELKPSWCAFSLISLFGFVDFKVDFISYEFNIQS